MRRRLLILLSVGVASTAVYGLAQTKLAPPCLCPPETVPDSVSIEKVGSAPISWTSDADQEGINSNSWCYYWGLRNNDKQAFLRVDAEELGLHGDLVAPNGVFGTRNNGLPAPRNNNRPENITLHYGWQDNTVVLPLYRPAN